MNPGERGGAGATEERGSVEGMKEPEGAGGMKGRGEAGATEERGSAEGMKEPDGAGGMKGRGEAGGMKG